MPDPEKSAVPVLRLAILSAVLFVQMGVFYGAAHYETPPVIAALAQFPNQVADWRTIRDIPIEKGVQEVLRADDTLSRVYADTASGESASLFIAFFRTQRRGQAPHSPKNCLPGAGFEPTESGAMDIPVPGHGNVQVSRYLVSRGEEHSLVLYWYQSRNRTIASEYAAKFWLVADSIRYHRSDTAIVRVVVPVGADVPAADRAGRRFVQTFYPLLLRSLTPVS